MPAYIVATVRIRDPQRFALYVKAIAGVSERFGGQYLVRGAVAEVLEGEAEVGERVVVSRFPNAQAARDYVNAPDYIAGAQLRIDAAEVETRLIIDPAG
jgi:uncharacterized protein (DUF1330 family)